MPVEDLKQSQMMNHMLEALENGEDIGHYGRLTFAMVGVYFANDDELVQVMTQDHDADEREVRAMVQQVREKGYNPPNREKILEWQQKQDFQICPNPDDPDACNVYSELEISQGVLEDIQEYRAEEQVARDS
jgi:DNA primase large subunit